MREEPGCQLTAFNNKGGKGSPTSPSLGTLIEPAPTQSIRGKGRSGAFITLMLISLLLFWLPLHSLLQFADHSEFSYIPLVPLISAYLILIRRHYVLSSGKPYPVTGSVIVLLGLVLFSVSRVLSASLAAGHLWLSTLAIVITWCGFFVISYGAQAARNALLPLGLLFFMVPPPPHIAEAVVAFLQHGSAVAAYFLFRMMGVPAIREGMVISLPHLTIEVAPECSGIRSSVSLLILVLAGANLYLHSHWNKILLVALLVPLSIMRNAVRIFVLSILGIYVDPQFLNGPLHHRGGILFFFLAFAILIPVIIVMRRWEREQYSLREQSAQLELS